MPLVSKEHYRQRIDQLAELIRIDPSLAESFFEAERAKVSIILPLSDE
jgi:hypothetical protein